LNLLTLKSYTQICSIILLLDYSNVAKLLGYKNTISLSSTRSEADDNIKFLDKKERNCLFPEENTDLKIYKQYSYYNCKFECALFYAQSEVFKKYKNICQPWFFPTSSESLSFCNPWESFDFLQIMSDEIPDNLCSHCLPDCTKTSYETKQTMTPFPYCNIRNIGANQKQTIAND
jgi:hypothetical protein